MPKDGLRSALGALRHAELVIARGLDGERYSFKHALVRDAAYAGLLKSRRVRLRAGKIAVARFANAEAIAHLRRGIEAVSGFADAATKDRLELDLQLALGP